jgi:hypothetical protein
MPAEEQSMMALDSKPADWTHHLLFQKFFIELISAKALPNLFMP